MMPIDEAIRVTIKILREIRLPMSEQDAIGAVMAAAGNLEAVLDALGGEKPEEETEAAADVCD